MANLVPEDILFFQILARLPLKFLLRLTLVCKQWYFLITNPQSSWFHIVHASHNLHNSTSFAVDWYYDDRDSGFNIVNKDQDNVLINRINDSIANACKQILSFCDSIPEEISEEEDVYEVYTEKAVGLVGCVHGLVCFTQNFMCLYFIWNPVTKMFKIVSKPSRELGENICCCRSSFCYDPVGEDFKIIEIERYEMESELGKVLFRVKVYSCNLETWTEINVTDDFIPNSDFYIAVTLKGRLFVKFHSEPDVLVSFDVHDGVFRWLPCAEHSIGGAKCCHYINWKGSFGVSVYKKQNEQRGCYGQEVVYTFDETSSTWVEEYIVPMPLEIPELYRSVLGLEYGHIVVDECYRSLQLFEAQSSQFKNIISSTPTYDVMPYRESLVRINGMQQL